MDEIHIKERNRKLRLQLKTANNAYSRYKIVYRKWQNAFNNGKWDNARELEMQLNIRIKKANEAYIEANRSLKLFRWWLNFSE